MLADFGISLTKDRGNLLCGRETTTMEHLLLVAYYRRVCLPLVSRGNTEDPAVQRERMEQASCQFSAALYMTPSGSESGAQRTERHAARKAAMEAEEDRLLGRPLRKPLGDSEPAQASLADAELLELANAPLGGMELSEQVKPRAFRVAAVGGAFLCHTRTWNRISGVLKEVRPLATLFVGLCDRAADAPARLHPALRPSPSRE